MAATSAHRGEGLAGAPARIDVATAVGAVSLTVSDLDRSRTFYERAIGLCPTELDDGTVAFGVAGERPLVELRGDSSAPRLNRRAPGLYHLAILVPTRLDLAFAVARLAETRWPLDGASDHLVSEALYLSDPDGNGIEIYRDRPRAEWTRVGDQLQMSTLPLDLNDVLGELKAATELQLAAPSGTTIGHVHLQVADLREAEAFYHGVLGFDVMVRGYPGALFVSAGGYHHHIGLNTWHSDGAPPAASGSVGLRSFAVDLPDERALDAVLARVQGASLPSSPEPGGVLVPDPSGNGVVLKTRTAAG
ncbi:MAG TPA: VOC family protein [Solirubrobacteraceae bacterium]|nr:VOC family protein [Solirubrobacteraceae bacterium]